MRFTTTTVEYDIDKLIRMIVKVKTCFNKETELFSSTHDIHACLFIIYAKVIELHPDLSQLGII